MSSYDFADVEVYADREEELQALFAELAQEDGADAELPPIIQDEVPGDEWEWAARPPSYLN